MRTRDEINKAIADSVDLLEKLIEISISNEQENEKRCNEIEIEIENLKKEVSFDDTLSGLAYNLTQNVMKRIGVLLDELEQKTGVELIAVFKPRNELKKNNE